MTDDGLQSFTADDGVSIAFATWGDIAAGPPVVLQHGFVANHVINWVLPGMVDALTEAGRTVVALDARGHGASGKPHDPAFYGESRMATDLMQLGDNLGLQSYDLVGYSMGGIISSIVGSRDPRVRRLSIGGIGSSVVDLGGVDQRALPADDLVRALLNDDPSTETSEGARGFRAFADSIGADRFALAAQAQRVNDTPIALDQITAPTLVVAGTEDELATEPERLAAAIANGELLTLPGDHMAVPASPEYHQAVADFLGNP